MTREIKFRAWWKNEKYNPKGGMYFVGGLLFAKQQQGEPEYDMQKGVYEVGLMDRENNSKIGWNRGSECIVMQDTGLFDKNGVEIYEGDIISYFDTYWSDKTPRVCEVKYEKGYFAPFLDQVDSEGTTFLYMYKDSIEVIGNLYEHPHLLTNLT